VFCYTEVENAPLIVRDDKEGVKHAEGKLRNREEIHCSDGLAVIAQKRHPWFCRLRISRRFLIHRNTLRSEISKPSIFNSP
jgi:hypothetical protein